MSKTSNDFWDSLDIFDDLSINMIKMNCEPTNVMKRNKTIIIEGNIGNGKSTFIKYLEKIMDFELLPEPVPKWTNFKGHNLLQLLYEKPNEWSFPFQLFASLTMFKNHLKKSDKTFKIMERSIFSSSAIFLEAARIEKRIHPIHYEIISEWLEFVKESIEINVDLIIYLRNTPETSLLRIKKRNRPEEQNIKLQYVELIHQLYENWISTQNQIPIIIIDSNCDKKQIQTEYIKALEAIKNLKSTN